MVSSSLRAFVRERAGDRCEYCQLDSGSFPYIPFHIEHIIARKHGGQSTAENLALSCHKCSLHKGPNLSGFDAKLGVVTLFHPRLQDWEAHFRMEGPMIIGLTDQGRVTVEVLAMNAPKRVELRAELLR
jgi:hypothetical protein